MDFGIAGKVAFVSGGSRGIGREVAKMLADEGCLVMVAARGQADIDDTVTTINNAGGIAAGVSAELTDHDEILKALDTCRQTFGSMPDIAITNVRGPGPARFMDADPEQFVQTFHDLTISAIRLAQAVVPHMKEKGWGRLVSINSTTAKEPPAYMNNILANSIRSSGVSLNKELCNAFGPFGITVNSVCAGHFASETMDQYYSEVAASRSMEKAQLLEDIIQQVPARRLGTVAEQAALVVFLCSELGGYITGANIPVDGGQHRSAW